jgi:hypothetical protein
MTLELDEQETGCTAGRSRVAQDTGARWTTAVARGEGLITEGVAAAMSCVTCIASGSQSV